jgi:hypothetical protein
LKKLIIALFIFCAPFTSSAWGLLGHRVIGQIADSYLTKKAKKAITSILGNESVAMSSNWADFVKSDRAYDYLGNWHYVNFKAGLSQQQFMDFLAADTATNAYTKIKFLANELKNKNLEQDKKILYLRVLIHLVGDIHQPMHTGRSDDFGGNRIRVLWFRDTTNLHSVWDDKLPTFQQLSYTEYATAINHASKDELRILLAEPLETWLYQSYTVAEKLYAEIKTPYQNLDFRYNYNNLQTMNTQFLRGGVHLAALFNQIFSN